MGEVVGVSGRQQHDRGRDGDSPARAGAHKQQGRHDAEREQQEPRDAGERQHALERIVRSGEEVPDRTRRHPPPCARGGPRSRCDQHRGDGDDELAALRRRIEQRLQSERGQQRDGERGREMQALRLHRVEDRNVRREPVEARGVERDRESQDSEDRERRLATPGAGGQESDACKQQSHRRRRRTCARCSPPIWRLPDRFRTRSVVPTSRGTGRCGSPRRASGRPGGFRLCARGRRPCHASSAAPGSA